MLWLQFTAANDHPVMVSSALLLIMRQLGTPTLMIEQVPSSIYRQRQPANLAEIFFSYFFLLVRDAAFVCFGAGSATGFIAAAAGVSVLIARS